MKTFVIQTAYGSFKIKADYMDGDNDILKLMIYGKEDEKLIAEFKNWGHWFEIRDE